ncbi:thioredoxin-dependent thiol peroxidase [bacterium]|nr:thioredoxin-dependent thiol peroxidase [bacterium]|tara:strand:- start:40 stop:498 length:459 start_codon:yes stop_codon:yes gene_type:complete
MNSLKEGDSAPDFSGTDQNGDQIKLSDFSGKKLILYFYPKDDTPGCTKEACNLRDNYQELKNNDFEVIGVSADNSAKHLKFIDKYELPFSLIADIEKTIINAYQCWGLKKFMGREYDGILRKTFIIENNKIVKLFEKVKTADHFQQIMEALD